MRYFQLSEFDCKCGGLPNCPKNLMNPVFLERLDALRHKLGFPLPVASGYRCPAHNVKVSTTGLTGPHTSGLAADLRVSGRQAYAILELAADFDFSGIGVRMHGPAEGRFIHLDMIETGPRPNCWSYP
jgi:uncharacterized protein YcbK (DUF882 family)